MRPKLYCQGVRSGDDGRLTACISDDEDLESPNATVVTITAPFTAFDPEGVPRQWHYYKVKVELVGDVPTEE